ncbi:hypothetical protein PMAYCL1PPCAC_09572, partial [Pristionchus mayeri]
KLFLGSLLLAVSFAVPLVSEETVRNELVDAVRTQAISVANDRLNDAALTADTLNLIHQHDSIAEYLTQIYNGLHR